MPPLATSSIESLPDDPTAAAAILAAKSAMRLDLRTAFAASFAM